MEIIKTIKQAVFAETDDCGKVCQVKWTTATDGVATILVPTKAYKRFPKRAALRAVRVKVPNAVEVHSVKEEYGVVNHGADSAYFLVRAAFSTE